MAYGILIQSQVAATSGNDAAVRWAKCASDVENGSLVQLDGISTDKSEREVWTAKAPETDALANLWMVAEPTVVTTAIGGKKFRGLTPDPRDFINHKGEVFTVIKLFVGDIVTLSADAVGGTKGSNKFVVATDGEFKAQWAAAAVAGTSLKLIEETYISIADGTIGTQRIPAYRFEVVAN